MSLLLLSSLIILISVDFLLQVSPRSGPSSTSLSLLCGQETPTPLVLSFGDFHWVQAGAAALARLQGKKPGRNPVPTVGLMVGDRAVADREGMYSVPCWEMSCSGTTAYLHHQCNNVQKNVRSRMGSAICLLYFMPMVRKQACCPAAPIFGRHERRQVKNDACALS